MSTSEGPAGPHRPAASKPPSVVPAVLLLGFAAVLIVVVLIKPAMASWLKLTITGLVVLTVITLLIYAAKLFRDTSGRGRR